MAEMEVGKFWLARFSRLYPVYVFSLIVSLGMLLPEFHAHSLPSLHHRYRMLTLLLLQGWSPTLSTFWNTPAWTMSTEVFFYMIFPMVVRWKRPAETCLAAGPARWALVPGNGVPRALYLAAPRRRFES
jgi:peptidoglycan/LPS O-acetylase OafA/YrhL